MFYLVLSYYPWLINHTGNRLIDVLCKQKNNKNRETPPTREIPRHNPTRWLLSPSNSILYLLEYIPYSLTCRYLPHHPPITPLEQRHSTPSSIILYIRRPQSLYQQSDLETHFALLWSNYIHSLPTDPFFPYWECGKRQSKRCLTQDNHLQTYPNTSDNLYTTFLIALYSSLLLEPSRVFLLLWSTQVEYTLLCLISRCNHIATLLALVSAAVLSLAKT